MAILAALALAAGAVAQTEPPAGDDIVGIYTGDFGTHQPSWTRYEGVGPQVTVYIVFSGLSHPGIAGWELKVGQEGTGVMLLSASLLGEGALNLYPMPTFLVGLGTPMTAPVGDYGAWPVASLLYFLTGTAPTVLTLGPIEATSFPEEPGPLYSSSEQVGLLVRAYTARGENSGFVFGFNTGWQPIEGRTWGGVKGMYR